MNLKPLFAIACLLCCGTVAGGEIIVSKGAQTSLDRYLKFKVDNYEIDSIDIIVDAHVENISDQVLNNIEIAITLIGYTDDDKEFFINRQSAVATPQQLGPGDTSFVKMKVKHKNETVTDIVWSAINGMVLNKR